MATDKTLNPFAPVLRKIAAGEIHTVLLVFPDMQGRWMGKRATGRYFAETVAGHGPAAAPHREVLRRQLERVAAAGYSVKMASELEFYLFRETYESAQKKAWHGLEHFGSYIEDYHILQGTKEEFVVGEIRNLM